MINMKDLIKKQNQEVRKETGMIKEDTINEINFDKIKLPSVVNRFLDKFVDSMKGANLNRMKRAAILYKVIDAAGMTPQQLMADIQKIKTAMKEGKLTEKKMDRKKAAIILKQIGGNRFIAMTGAKGFAFSDKYMSFKIGRNSKGINFVRIGHNAMDTYDMEFGFVSVKGIKVKKKVKGVYADMLGTMFKKYTGMNVSL